MQFVLKIDGMYESKWRLGSRDIPVTVYDSDTRKPEVAEPHLSKVKPLLRQWKRIKGEVLKELNSRGYNLSKIVPTNVVIDIQSRDGIGAGSFLIIAHLVDLAPEEERFASIFGKLDTSEVQSVDIRSGY